MADYLPQDVLNESLTPPEKPRLVDREERPVLDFGNFSYGDSKRLPILQSKAAKAVADNDEVTAEALLAEVEKILCGLIVSMPRSWLVRSAPNPIDWDDPSSINYLRNDKVPELMALIGSRNQEVYDNSKNLPKP